MKNTVEKKKTMGVEGKELLTKLIENAIAFNEKKLFKEDDQVLLSNFINSIDAYCKFLNDYTEENSEKKGPLGPDDYLPLWKEAIKSNLPHLNKLTDLTDLPSFLYDLDNSLKKQSISKNVTQENKEKIKSCLKLPELKKNKEIFSSASGAFEPILKLIDICIKEEMEANAEWVRQQIHRGRGNDKHSTKKVVLVLDAIAKTDLKEEDKQVLIKFMRYAEENNNNPDNLLEAGKELNACFKERTDVDEHKNFFSKLLDKIFHIFSTKGFETQERKAINNVFSFFSVNKPEENTTPSANYNDGPLDKYGNPYDNGYR